MYEHILPKPKGRFSSWNRREAYMDRRLCPSGTSIPPGPFTQGQWALRARLRSLSPHRPSLAHPLGTCTSGGQNDNLLLREGTRFKLCSKKLQPPVICRLEATKCSKRSIGKVSNPTNWPRILVNLQDSWDGWQVKTCEANRPTLHSDIWILTHLLNGPQA